ncbi:MAG: VanZ family protein [Deltaproteobacteria bacterium]|nr:MAG: VanZ family protein [Deltaproteobacteria bacterium]
MGYFTLRWLAVYGYLLTVLIATPCLPLLIEWASSRWTPASISAFVLGVEISMGVLLLISAGTIFFYNIQKFPSFALIVGGFISFASLFYFIVPNPYELTHLPEYAILGILTQHAIKARDRAERENASETYFYLRSALITGAIGTIDEVYQGILPLRYFAWYDIFLNWLGGLLGLALLWGINKE